MSTTLLASSIEKAVKREAEQASREQATADKRTQLQKKQMESPRLSRQEISQAEKERQKRVELEMERNRIKVAILDFTARFAKALIIETAFWSSKDLMSADAYATALLNQSGNELPNAPKHITSVVNRVFAKGIVLQGDKLPGNVFAGQKQPWFNDLLTEVTTPVEKTVTSDEQSSENVRATKLVYSSRSIVSEEQLANPASTPTQRTAREDAPIANAITPSKKRRKSAKIS